MDASVEIIKSVKPHPNADQLDLVQVLGFQCVTQKELYSERDIVIYIRPDTVLPEEEWAEVYRKYSPKRVKSVKLRGSWSEGIIIPLESVQHKFDKDPTDNWKTFFKGLLGQEISQVLGVKHYEPPIPQDLSAKGGLPYQIPKTDEERWENFDEGKLPFDEKVDITLKIDGASTTIYYNFEDDKFGVTSRSLEFKDDAVNHYTANVERYGIKEKLIAYCKENGVSLALRGESYGAGIQGMKLNPHAKENLNFALFSVYNITNREYERKGSDYYFLNVAAELEIPTVPMVAQDVILTQNVIDLYSTGMKKLDGKYFEGVVVQHANGSFKIINKYYDSQK